MPERRFPVKKKPRIAGLFHSHGGTGGDGRAARAVLPLRYICAIIAAPKPEQESWVEPGRRRAKS